MCHNCNTQGQRTFGEVVGLEPVVPVVPKTPAEIAVIVDPVTCVDSGAVVERDELPKISMVTSGRILAILPIAGIVTNLPRRTKLTIITVIARSALMTTMLFVTVAAIVSVVGIGTRMTGVAIIAVVATVTVILAVTVALVS
jgi:hypothetical protein